MPSSCTTRSNKAASQLSGHEQHIRQLGGRAVGCWGRQALPGHPQSLARRKAACEVGKEVQGEGKKKAWLTLIKTSQTAW